MLRWLCNLLFRRKASKEVVRAGQDIKTETSRIKGRPLIPRRRSEKTESQHKDICAPSKCHWCRYFDPCRCECIHPDLYTNTNLQSFPFKNGCKAYTAKSGEERPNRPCT